MKKMSDLIERRVAIADDLHVSPATISTRLKQEEGENAKLD